MDLLNNPLLRRTLAPQPDDPHAESRKRLLDALLQMRKRAEMLAGEIHRDLPDFTVHDITHLDALWEMADLIAGPDYPLNPLEAFALGAVFLLHDLGLGLAAYPGGLAELKKGPGWQDALSTYLRKHLERIPTAEELASPPPEVERMAVQERLRSLHAEQAERLAFASWRHGGGPEYHLIEDPDLRQAIGHLLGEIAHSHWWPAFRLSEFGTVRGALPNLPRSWTVDPLKVAVLLRTADAAHLDASRAPGFLIALRRPEGISEAHWRFQSHLSQPQVEDDRLVYTASPFSPSEVDAWWLCEETLRMVDRELQQVDALLYDMSRTRLRARSVAGIESPKRLRKYIGTSGWTPVDARLHVSNVAELARKLGGEQLYGDDPTIPLRELIQNASDAVRARRLLQGRSSSWGEVTVRLGVDEQGPWIEVEDTGIGMSEAVLAGPLLDFGTTYWGSILMREEHEGLWARGFEPTGRFGIGFFSVFMWGQQARISTRRYQDGQQETRILHFRTGLEARPAIRLAESEEQLFEGGTRVRVWLTKEPQKPKGLLCPRGGSPVSLGALCSWIAPSLDVYLYVEDERGRQRVVAASDWLTMDSAELIARTKSWDAEEEEGSGSLLRIIKDSRGSVLGRASINPRSKAIITVGGLRASSLPGTSGILVGSPEIVSRDRASILADPVVLTSWASDQAKLIAASSLDEYFKLASAATILALGGDVAELPIAKWKERLVNLNDIEAWGDAPDTVFVLRFRIEVETVFPPGVLMAYSSPLEGRSRSTPTGLIKKALAKAWRCSESEIKVWIGLEIPGGTGLRLSKSLKRSLFESYRFSIKNNSRP